MQNLTLTSQWFVFATVIKAENDNENEHCGRCVADLNYEGIYELIYMDVSVKGAFGLMFMSSDFGRA